MTFFTFDDHEVPADTRQVLGASALLEVTEFRLFELAYERWFGRPATTELIEPPFTHYMFQAVAPPWVRQFCREVLDCEESGTLDPSDFGVFPVCEDISMYRKGIRYIMVVALVLVSLHVVAMLVATY